MAVVKINTFNGGKAQDNRSFSVNENSEVNNFDVFTDNHYLSPYPDMTTETSSGTLTDYAFTDVDALTVSGTTYLLALGQTSSGTDTPAFWRKNSADISTTWTYYASGTGHKKAGTLVVYQGFAYCISYDNTPTYSLQKYDSATSVSTIASLGGAYSSVIPRPFVHPQDDMLYMASANVVSRYDAGTNTFTSSAFVVPTTKVIVSLTDYGSLLAIACRPKNGVGNSTLYLWNKSLTETRATSVIDLGQVQVNIVENIGNVLIMTMCMNAVGSYVTVNDNRLIIKGYSGGAVTTIKDFQTDISVGNMNNIKVKMNDKLFFGFSNDTVLYCFGKNDTGEWFCSQNRAFPSGLQGLNGLSMIGDLLYVAYSTSGGNNLFYRTGPNTGDSAAYSTVSSYKTTFNPNMPIEDRHLRKQLEAVYVSFTGGGVLTSLEYSFDGGTTKTAISDASTGEVVIEATANTDGTPFDNGYELVFTVKSTGNAKIKEIAYRYSIMDTQVDIR